MVPFWGSYLESYKGIPKRNYYGASGYSEQVGVIRGLGFRVKVLLFCMSVFRAGLCGTTASYWLGYFHQNGHTHC